MSMSRLCRHATVAAATVACLTALPALAGVSPALVDADVTTTPTGYSVVSECALGVGYTSDPRFITYVVHATAESAGLSVPLATSVQCTVYDAADSSRTYGGASGALPGPHAEAVGFATVPVGRIPAACVTGGATFLDGNTITSAKTCP